MSDDSDFSLNGPDTLRGAMLLLVLGLGFTGYGVYDYVQQSDAIENAVEVDATITEVSVVTEGTGTGESTEVKYEPRVEFRYDHQGTTYSGTNLFPATIAPEYDTRSKAESVVQEYEKGATVTAYVNPANPDNGFLKNKRSKTPLTAAGIGVVISLFGTASVLKTYRARQ